MTGTSSLEERVAALEAALSMPPGPSSRPWTDAELAEFRERFTEAVKQQPIRVIPPEPPLTPDQIRQLLSECVTTVRPGETLAVRVPWETRPAQVAEYQRYVEEAIKTCAIPFRVLVLAGDELGAVQPPAL